MLKARVAPVVLIARLPVYQPEADADIRELPSTIKNARMLRAYMRESGEKKAVGWKRAFLTKPVLVPLSLRRLQVPLMAIQDPRPA